MNYDDNKKKCRYLDQVSEMIIFVLILTTFIASVVLGGNCGRYDVLRTIKLAQSC